MASFHVILITFVTPNRCRKQITVVNSQKFAKRLQKILDHYGISATEFAQNLSINRSTISHLLSGRNKPSLDVVMKVLEAYPEVELYWLLNGTGNFPSPSSLEENPKTATSTTPQKMIPPVVKDLDRSLGSEPGKTIERVMIFFSDGSFRSYE